MSFSRKSFSGIGVAAVSLLVVGLAACGDDSAERDEETGQVTGAGDADVFEIQVGDCFDDEAADEISSLPVVPCDESHDNEVFHNHMVPGGDEFPGADVLDAAFEEQCAGEPFESFVGVPYEESELFVGGIEPTEQSWEEGGDRELLCVIYDPAGPVTGSLEGAAR